MQNTDLLSQARQLCRERYGTAKKIRLLPGELDYNFEVEFETGEKCILKVMNSGATKEQVDFQIQLITHLQAVGLSLRLPEVRPTGEGALQFEIRLDGESSLRRVWMLKWIDGRLWTAVTPKTRELRNSLGRQLGLLCRGLEGFDHPFAHRFLKWDPKQAMWVRDHLAIFSDHTQARTAHYFLDLFEEEVLPLAKSLPQAVVYGDANDYNIIVDGNLAHPEVRGFIDYGDAVHSYRINDLAIACAYACMDLPDPLRAMAEVVERFHEACPLTEEEMRVLFPLVGARLLISVVCSAINRQENPENAYLNISEQPAWELMTKLLKVPPALAHCTVRQACGLEPCPASTAFRAWLERTNPAFHPVIVPTSPYRPLDLSVGSLDLGNNPNFEDDDRFERKIDHLLEGQTGIGGYAETRPFYTTDDYLTEGNEGPVWRTVHLGTDIWVPPGTPVYAPFPGTITALKDNRGDRNYGPTVILEHTPPNGPVFHTLYGHLSRRSLERFQVGQQVAAGQQIAEVGPRPENGNWPPHLHFQVMLDMLGQQGDFPGVAFPAQQAVWLSICPDPNLLLRANLGATPEPRQKEDILKVRQKLLGRNLSVSYRDHLHIVRGYKQYLYDDTGRRFLDMVNNVAHVGHEHPHVVSAAQRQMGVLNTNARYLHANLIDYAEALLARFPPEFSVCYFVNSGSEANELALRMARTATGHRNMIAVEVGYHGNTTGCVDISSYKFDGKGGSGSPSHTHVVPIPDTFRGRYREAGRPAASKYAAHIREAIDAMQASGQGLAGFICESILSCGGQIVLPPGYLQEAFAHVRAAGGICIVDEVQVGFGRVGKHFWGFELQEVVPDIVTLGKPIGNGHPLGAVVTTAAIAETFANGMEFFSTFGGNPVSCAVGKAVLEVIDAEDLSNRAQQTGNYLKEGLRALQDKYPIIGDVRGEGLFLGIEFVRDRELLTPAPEEASFLVNRMREKSILLSTDGPFENVVKIKPPLCFNKQNADFVLAELDRTLRADFLQMP